MQLNVRPTNRQSFEHSRGINQRDIKHNVLSHETVKFYWPQRKLFSQLIGLELI